MSRHVNSTGISQHHWPGVRGLTEPLEGSRPSELTDALWLRDNWHLSHEALGAGRAVWGGVGGGGCGLRGDGGGADAQCHSPALDLPVQQPPGHLLVLWGLGHGPGQQPVVPCKASSTRSLRHGQLPGRSGPQPNPGLHLALYHHCQRLQSTSGEVRYEMFL